MDKQVSLFADERGVQRSTLKQQVADKLIYMISTGLISSDDFLPSERKLSEAFRVSRETIRGALQILSSDQVIEVGNGARTKILMKSGEGKALDTVSGLDMLQSYDVTTVVEARRVVEVSILRSAAMNVTQANLDSLLVMMEAQEKVLDDAVAFQISDREFHNLIYKVGGNTLLEQMASNIYSYALEHRNMALKAERATERSLREHQQIYRALESHDPDAAERAITSHVDSIFKSTIMMQQASV